MGGMSDYMRQLQAQVDAANQAYLNNRVDMLNLPSINPNAGIPAQYTGQPAAQTPQNTSQQNPVQNSLAPMGMLAQYRAGQLSGGSLEPMGTLNQYNANRSQPSIGSGQPNGGK